MNYRIFISIFKRNRLAMVGAVMMILFLLLVVFAPLIAPYNPIEQDYKHLLESPSQQHFMGTDRFGRDIFSRVVYGSRYAFLIGFGVVGLEAFIGIALGLTAGYYGGRVDTVIMRVADGMLSIPAMVLALAIAGSLGGGVLNVIIAMTIVSWAYFARLMRGQVLPEKEKAYVEAARALGASTLRIITHHILPNTVATVIVYSTLEIPWAILFSAALSFLGVGVRSPTPEWGAIIADGRVYLHSAWWISTFPGLALMLVVLGFNFVGDGFREALDPKMVRPR